MVNSWLRCVKTVKSASMTPVSPLHHCRYETGLFNLIYNINSHNKKFLELSFVLFFQKKHLHYLKNGKRKELVVFFCQEGPGPEGHRGARVVWVCEGKYLLVSGFDR